MTAVKVCCIRSLDEARLALDAGAAAIGLVSAMPSGPGPIPEPLIAEIATRVPPGTDTFLLTSRRDAAAIAEQHGRCGTTTIQLVDEVPRDELAALRDRRPRVRLVQVIHVAGAESLAAARAAAPLVDALLLDSGNPSRPVKELGGTGRTHDWAISRAIRDAVATPVWLAGGLRPENVAAAIAAVRPHGVDVCSGLRTDGALDPGRLHAFMAAVAAAGGRPAADAPSP